MAQVTPRSCPHPQCWAGGGTSSTDSPLGSLRPPSRPNHKPDTILQWGTWKPSPPPPYSSPCSLYPLYALHTPSHTATHTQTLSCADLPPSSCRSHPCRPVPTAHLPNAGTQCRPWQLSGVRWDPRVAISHTPAGVTRHRPTAEERAGNTVTHSPRVGLDRQPWASC